MHNLVKYILQFILFILVFVVIEGLVCLIAGCSLFSFGDLAGWQMMLVIVLAVSVNELLIYLWTRRVNARKRKNRDGKYDKLFDEAGL